MKFMDSILIFSLLIVGNYGATSELDLPTVRSVTALPPADIFKHKTTTTVAPKTTESTTSTTEVPTTSTAQSTSSSSVAPITTTTSAQTTTTKSSSTTAPATSTTTVQPPTPNPTPTPKPSEPEPSNWTLTEGNRTCILVELATQLNVSYISNDNKTKHLVYNIPKDPESNVSGNCGNTSGASEQYILINWLDKKYNALNMTFKLNHTTNEFTLNKLALSLDKAIFPNDANLSSYSYYYVGSTFATPKQNSYHCTRPQVLNLTNSESSTNVTGTVILSHTLLEAYHEGKNKQFSTPIDCDAINTPDIVPIAVGIALIALVIIVLIAYVIGRRRSQAHGYVSM